MAGLSNNTKFTPKLFSHDIFFDGALLSNTRASLVVELIKYFLYERQQIPLPVDELKSQLILEENLNAEKKGQDESLPTHQKQSNVHDNEMNKIISKSDSSILHKTSGAPDVALTDLTNVDTSYTNVRHCFLNNHNWGGVSTSVSGSHAKVTKVKGSLDRKAKILVSELTLLFESLQSAFASCPEIEQVAVVLGGTVMNPKESYVIKFPPPCPDADYIPLVSCKRTLFQQMISEDILGTMSANISPTSMMILVSAPRSCPVKGFMPKQFIRSPRTGTIIYFNFHCNYQLPVCYDLTMCGGDLEISGIVPLESQEKDRITLSEKSPPIDNGERHKNGGKCNGSIESEENDKNCDIHVGLGLNNLKVSVSNEDISGPVCTDALMSYSNASVNLKQLCLVAASPVVNGDGHDTNTQTNQMNTECIWYQSPFVIKGYRNKELSNNRLMCS